MRKQNKLEGVVQDLFDKHGHIKPSMLLDEAQNEDSSIHNLFEWDDTKAAHEYRLDQSRKMLRKVKIIYDGEPERLIHIPKVIVKDESKEGEYKPVTAIVKVQDDFARALSEAVGKLSSAQQAVHDLEVAANGKEDREAIVVILKSLGVAKEAMSTLRH